MPQVAACQGHLLILLRKTAVAACVPKPDHRRFKVAAKGAQC